MLNDDIKNIEMEIIKYYEENKYKLMIEGIDKDSFLRCALEGITPCALKAITPNGSTIYKGGLK